MTDRELLESLRRQQTELRQSLARLDLQLESLEARVPGDPGLPPVPADLPPLPVFAPAGLPSVPTAAVLPPLPAARPSLEFRLGGWFTRIGAVFGVISLALVLSLAHAYLFAFFGAAGILGLSGLFCMGIVVAALRLERREMRLFARSLLALGLAGLYVTLYAAYGFESLRVIRSPLLAGLLLLLWPVYVFSLAERRGSAAFAFLALALAYFSTAINPLGRFSLAADLLLAGTAVVFLLRRGWPSLSWLALFATYLALLRRLVIDQGGEVGLDTLIPLAPFAVYLIAAWVVFTAAVLLAPRTSFRRARIAFLSLNNGAFALLLALVTYAAGYGYRAVGWTLLWTGAAFLGAGLLAGHPSDPAAPPVGRVYFGQGLAVLTAGLLGVFSGMTRGILLALETVLLGSFAGRTLKIAAAGAALFAALFLGWEIGVDSHHPWVLGAIGAAALLVNAGRARHGLRSSPLARRGFVPLASYYCALALGLIAVTLATKLGDEALPPALAAAALLLTFSVYLFPLYELPPLAQILLLAAQALVLFPVPTGEALPRASTAWVAVLTLFLLAWWSRQRVTRYGPWIVALNFLYALALVGLAYQAVRPYTDAQGWMVGASLLAGGFLLFGALTRVWPLAAMGQVFLAAAVFRFYFPGDAWFPFPWIWWAAAIPIVTVFATGRAALAWLREFPETPESARLPLQLLAHGYLLLALAMLARAIFGLASLSLQPVFFLFLGTFLLGRGVRRGSPFGVRCSFVLSATGLFLLVGQVWATPSAALNLLNGLALLSFLGQPIFLRHAVRPLVTAAESWLVILLSAGAGWFFVTEWVIRRWGHHYLTMGWALFALFLFFFGLIVRERRQRWCGLVVLAAALVRVVLSDIWKFSRGYELFTFAVLTLVTLGLGYISERFKTRP